MIIYRIVFLNC